MLEDLYRAAQQAQERVTAAEVATDRAKHEFRQAIRRLYVNGASLREIGAGLQLSHQRVHQLLGATPRSPFGRIRRPQPANASTCSFCAATDLRPAEIVAGAGVLICRRCVSEGLNLRAGGQSHHLAATKTEHGARCSFCGTVVAAGSDLVTGVQQENICVDCLQMAAAILEQP